MSYVCAKPACTQSVQVWLDFAPVSQQVIEREDRTDVSVGLCEMHSERFTVPAGWSLDRLSRSDLAESPLEAEVLIERTETTRAEATNRTHTRDRPWFLALSDAVIDEQPLDETGTPDVSADDGGVSGDDEPSAGSLLHRAFHGPSRAADKSRAERELDELELRRAARVPFESKDNGTAELPFPPFESEHRVAVS